MVSNILLEFSLSSTKSLLLKLHVEKMSAWPSTESDLCFIIAILRPSKMDGCLRGVNISHQGSPGGSREGWQQIALGEDFSSGVFAFGFT
jgi:hypothetical protein